MLTLSLLRHAKSSWDDPRLDDHERPLTKRGIKDAPRIATWLADHDLRPDLVLCSSAMRTRATLALLLSAWAEPPPDSRVEDALYLADPARLLAVVHTASPGARQVLVIAHNPGLHALALELTGGGQRKAVAGLAAGFPTSALAVLTFEAKDWSEVHRGAGRLEHFVTPRGLA